MEETRRRGFAAMDPAKQKAIARKGGKAAHEKGTAHEFTPDEARAAGRKGGASVSRDRDYMAAIGKRGGERRSRGKQPVVPAAVAPAPLPPLTVQEARPEREDQGERREAA